MSWDSWDQHQEDDLVDLFCAGSLLHSLSDDGDDSDNESGSNGVSDHEVFALLLPFAGEFVEAYLEDIKLIASFVWSKAKALAMMICKGCRKAHSVFHNR